MGTRPHGNHRQAGLLIEERRVCAAICEESRHFFENMRASSCSEICRKIAAVDCPVCHTRPSRIHGFRRLSPTCYMYRDIVAHVVFWKMESPWRAVTITETTTATVLVGFLVPPFAPLSSDIQRSHAKHKLSLSGLHTPEKMAQGEHKQAAWHGATRLRAESPKNRS